ncbi:lysophospholipid acyltransferase family protein, partial [Rhizobium hidalgonense]
MLGRILRWLSKLPIGFLQSMGRTAARLIAHVQSASALATVKRNLLIAFPHLNEPERHQLAKQALAAQFQSMLEFVKCWGNPPAFSLNQIKHIDGEHLLIQAIADHNGVILVVPHFGSWEFINAWLCQFGDMTVMYKPSKNQPLDEFVLNARSRLSATLVPANENGVRQIFKALKQGGFTAILPDHVPDHSGGIYSDFMGQRVLTTTLVSKLAQKTQCSVVGLSCIRRNDGLGFDIVCDLLDSQILNKDLSVSVDSLNNEIKRIIARAPEQYMWGYKRFKQLENQQQVYSKSI